MQRSFRKYHRFLAPILALPLLLTVITGVIVTFIDDWGINIGLSSEDILKLHTGELIHLEAIYPLLNGIGLLGLLITGVSMTGLFNRRPRRSK